MHLSTLRVALCVASVFFAAAGCASSSHNNDRRPITLASDDPALADVAFMAGHWATGASRSGDRVEEHWTTATAGAMFGVSRTIRGGETVFFEYVRIERTPEGAFYIASPGGKGETRFRLIESGGGRAVFENPEHDFPQRIIYERFADGLHARVEGTQRGQQRQEEWRYRRAQFE